MAYRLAGDRDRHEFLVQPSAVTIASYFCMRIEGGTVKKRREINKLALNSEQIRVLITQDLLAIVGGQPLPTERTCKCGAGGGGSTE